VPKCQRQFKTENSFEKIFEFPPVHFPKPLYTRKSLKIAQLDPPYLPNFMLIIPCELLEIISKEEKIWENLLKHNFKDIDSNENLGICDIFSMD